MTTNNAVRQRLRNYWQLLETQLRTLEDVETPDLFVLRGVVILTDVTAEFEALFTELRRSTWPEPTVDQPDLDTLQAWMWDGCCEATDACITEPDGHCSHGHPSWLLKLGLI